MSDHTRATLRQDQQDQEDADEQDGTVDPAEADGIPAPKQNTTRKTTPTGTGPGSPAPAATETGLDPVLRSIAEESGWTPEDIDELYEANPDVAVRQFERLAENYANLSRQFLSAPAPVAAAPQVQQPAQVQQQTNQSVSQLPAGLTDEALERFAVKNGDEAADLIKVIRDHFVARDQLHEQRYQKFEQTANAAETRVVAQEASSTIGDLQKKFPTLYGTSSDPKALTVAQYQKQTELASLADQIRSGALNQGRTLSVKDALTRAHYIISRDSVKAEARQELRQRITDRARRVTQRPTQRNNPAAAGQTRSDDAAIEAASQKMAELGMTD
jgi:hypothetical protein